MQARPTGNRKQGLSAKQDQETPNAITNGYFKSFDGTRLFYSVEGHGKPMIFCYGLVCSSLHWTYQIEQFNQSHQAIWFDYRGHHNSDVPQDLSTLTIENIARDISIMMDELGLKDAVILGHSMGVNIVLEFYRLFPERVHAMVLANGTSKRPLETLFSTNAFQRGFEWLRKGHALAPDLFAKLWRSQHKNPLARSLIKFAGFNPYLTPDADIDLYLQQVSEMNPRVVLALMQNYDRYDARGWLHEVNVPTLILAGEQDHVIPLREQELLHQLIKGSELEIIRHGSHCPQMDLPELFNQKIADFLRRCDYE